MPNQLLISTPQGAQWAVASGQISIGPFTINGALGNVEVFTVAAMANGDNTFAVPAGSRGVIVLPPSGNNTNLTLRQVIADVGERIDKVQPAIELFDTTALPASIIVNSAGGFAGPLVVIFF